MKTRQTC